MHISYLDGFRNDPRVRFKEELVDGESFTIVSYMIADSSFWDIPESLETRGNAYDTKTGECVCAMFPKFFNLNERPETQESLIRDSIKHIFTKRDGSMVSPVLVNERVYFKTKKSFFSDVALKANSLLVKDVERLSRFCLEERITPIFEFTHRDHQIVLTYDHEPNFTLLACRDQETGEFLPYFVLVDLVVRFGGPSSTLGFIQKHDMNWNEMKIDISQRTNFEGYVLHTKDNLMVKWKTPWYEQMHRTMTELRERDIVDAVLNETVDDMIALLKTQGMDITPVLEIQTRVVNEIIQIKREVLEIVKKHQNLDVKSLALQLKTHPLFHLIVKEFKGIDPDYNEYWKKRFRHLSSLRCVYNSSFGSQ